MYKPTSSSSRTNLLELKQKSFKKVRVQEVSLRS